MVLTIDGIAKKLHYLAEEHMIDLSNLRPFELPMPITPKNMDEAVRLILPNREETAWTDPALMDFVAPTQNSDFCMSGTSYMCNAPVLTSQTVKDTLLYLQSFAVLDMDEHYFTRRAGGDSFMVLYTLEGSGAFECGGEQYLLKEGDGVFVDCSQPHEYHTVGSRWLHCDLHLSGPGAPVFYEGYTSNHSPAFHQTLDGTFPETLSRLIDHYQDLQPNRDLMVANDLSVLLTKLVREAPQSAPSESMVRTVQRAIDYMENHFSEEISLNDLAERFHVSKYHFAREFKSLTGSTPIDYVIQLRLDRACFLLRNTDLSVASIAETVGIENPPYFSNLFKRRRGLSPKKYRDESSVQ